MCFSAPVSFVVSGALAATAAVTVRKVKGKKYLPLAIMPLLFSIQQLIEGFIWVTPFDSSISLLLVYVFLFFAYFLWPFYFPLAILLVEPNKKRARIMKLLFVIGLVVSAGLVTTVIIQPPQIALVDCHIGHPYVMNFLYGIHFPFYLATVGLAPLLSTHKTIRLFALAIILSGLITFLINRVTFVSIWCFFAAILSLLLYLFLDKVRQTD